MHINSFRRTSPQPSVAIIGTGISGLSAAWLLAPHADVTVYERASRIGGHSNTVDVDLPDGRAAVDTGFIVYNQDAYPNLTALFRHLDVETCATNMSFAASLNGGAMEYSGASLGGLVAQKHNLLRPRFWLMLYDLQRFYRKAPTLAHDADHRSRTLGEFIAAESYGAAFVEDHLLPLSAAIWSAKPADILDYPVSAFVRFHENHGLLKFTGRPVWRTVSGGSRRYVEALSSEFANRIRLNARLCAIRRTAGGVELVDEAGEVARHDHVIVATHADQALSFLADPTPRERELLSSFKYSRNETWLHGDADLMPKRKSVWASWNFIGGVGQNRAGERLVVSYWMNRLQKLATRENLFVTLNPSREPRADLTYRIETYEHPIFNRRAIEAQRRLWSLQGNGGVWYCGSYFGSGFHEDGLQAGLAVAEELGRTEGLTGVCRPWQVENESARICIAAPAAAPALTPAPATGVGARDAA